MAIILVAVLISWLTLSANAQKKMSLPTIKKNSVSANILGTASYLGITYERVLTKKMIGEVGIGLIGYGAGITYYPLKNIAPKQLNPFVGLKYTNHAIVDGENKAVTYLPVGLTLFTARLINISLDAGPSYVRHKSPGYKPTLEEKATFPYNSFSFFGNLKVGFRF